jgi:autotransporter-associated beta strand protein
MSQQSHRKLVLLLSLWLIAARADALVWTWGTNPSNGDWNIAQNWTPAGVPGGLGDVAAFGVSTITDVYLSAFTQVDSLVFNPGASAYTITATTTQNLLVSGVGIVNDSGITQRLIAAGEDSSGSSGSIFFTNNASIGSLVTLVSDSSSLSNRDGALIAFFDNATAGFGNLIANGGSVSAANGGNIKFYDSSSADHAVLTVNGGIGNGNWGTMDFYDNSTAANATITNTGGGFLGGILTFRNNASAAQASIANYGGNAYGDGGARTFFRGSSSAASAAIINYGGAGAGAFGGFTGFYDSASAANSIITCEGSGASALPGSDGGRVGFQGNSTASEATIIATSGVGQHILAGGQIDFVGNSNGGTARIAVFGNALLAIYNHFAPGLTIGSLEGSGVVYLGSNTLTIGSNNLSTEFSGVIRDGGPYGNDPTGGSLTKIGSGTLVLSGQNIYTGQTIVNSGTLAINGSVVTPVIVNGGTLSGTGTIRSTSVYSGATLSPGNGTGILSVVGDLTLNLGANYLVHLNGPSLGAEYSQTDVAGAISLNSATLSLSLGFQAEPGMAFVILDNDGSDAISGNFNSLPEGAAFAADGQTFNISYLGGSGNDVVLTAVVPEPKVWTLVATGALLVLATSAQRRRSRA